MSRGIIPPKCDPSPGDVARFALHTDPAWFGRQVAGWCGGNDDHTVRVVAWLREVADRMEAGFGTTSEADDAAPPKVGDRFRWGRGAHKEQANVWTVTAVEPTFIVSCSSRSDLPPKTVNGAYFIRHAVLCAVPRDGAEGPQP